MTEKAEFRQYQDISISLGGVVAMNAVFSRVIHCRIEQVTDKAVQLRAYDVETRNVQLSKHTVWIPKKAFVKPEPIPGIGELSYLKLAKWFRPEGFTEWFLTRYADVSGQTAN
jgi:hypothetical protein